MKGFKIKVNDKEINAGLESGVTSVIITRVTSGKQNETFMNVSGLMNKTKYSWLDEKLKLNQSISIEFSEFDRAAVAKSRTKDLEEFGIKSKIKSYMELKRELEEGGHI